MYWIFLSILLVAVFMPGLLFAQETPPWIVCGGLDCDFNDLIRLVQEVINALIMFATLVVPFLMAYAAFLFITRGDDPNKIERGKQVFQNAITGFVIILSAWLVVSAILAGLSTDPNFIFLENVTPLEF